MSHFGVAVEYGLHVMTQLALLTPDQSPSARALAEFEGVPAAYLAKIMTALEKAGLVTASEGKGGGYRLAQPAESITFLDVVDAIEGPKTLFECTEVRQRCVLYAGKPPKMPGLCGIHAVMLNAERHMREQLSATTIADIARPLQDKTPPKWQAIKLRWFDEQAQRSIASGKSRRPNNQK